MENSHQDPKETEMNPRFQAETQKDQEDYQLFLASLAETARPAYTCSKCGRTMPQADAVGHIRSFRHDSGTLSWTRSPLEVQDRLWDIAAMFGVDVAIVRADYFEVEGQLR